MHIVWVNDHADFTGGCETYIHQTVKLLNQSGVSSSLLYQVGATINARFTAIFQGVFPMVDIKLQLKELDPDLIYIHGINDIGKLQQIAQSSIPKARFFHDQKLFCLREHKYTALGHKTCHKKLGLACYACLGFINKEPSTNQIQFNSLRKKNKELAINKRLDQFIVGSQYMANQLIQHGFHEDKVTVATLFSYQNDHIIPVLDEERNNKVEPNQLLFVGQLVRGKGLDTLLKALFESETNAHLVICGTGKMEQEYKSQVTTLGLNSQVRFLGQQNASQLETLYKQSSAVVIPARAPETFCLVGLEALQYGTPVIATNVGGMNEWFKPNYNGLSFCANNHTKLREQIDNLLLNPKTQQTLRNNIENDCYKRFSPNYHLSVLQNLFGHMLEAS